MNRSILTFVAIIMFGLGSMVMTSCGNTEKKQGHESHQHDEDGEDHHDHEGHDHE